MIEGEREGLSACEREGGEREERGKKQINQVIQQQGRKSVSNRSISVSQIVQKVVLQKKLFHGWQKF